MKLENSFLVLVFGVASLVLVGCDSQTTKSLCENPTGPIEGLSGVYEINSRDYESFGVKSSKVTIMPGDKKNQYQLKGAFQDDEEIIICNVNGQYVTDALDEDSGMYRQMRLYTSQVGLQLFPILYDKPALDAAGIPNKIVTAPNFMRKVVGDSLADHIESILNKFISILDDEGAKKLVVDNQNVPPAELLRHTKPESLGFSLFRK